MVVQSGAARRTLSRDPERAAQALAAAEESGRTALVELRRMLGLMSRGEGGSPARAAADAPAGRCADRARPRRRARRRAARATATVPATGRRRPRRLPRRAGGADQHAQARRADAAPPCRCDWTTGGAGARDHRRRRAERRGRQDLGGSGHGLVGMRERLELYGGHVDARPEGDGGFRRAGVDPAGYGGRRMRLPVSTLCVMRRCGGRGVGRGRRWCGRARCAR